MAFRKSKKQPEFADLKGILAQTKKQTESPLYQTLAVLIDRLTQFQAVTLEEVADINDSVSESQSTLNIVADKKATYLTTLDETLKLPNSVQLLAGTGITFDDSTPNRRTINSAASGIGNYYDSPLTDGNLDETHLIFAKGECIIVQVPV